MWQLQIDFFDLEAAVENNSPEMQYYFDKQTGKVLVILGETRSHLEELLQEAEPEQNRKDVVPEADLAEADKQMLADAILVEEDPSRFTEVPKPESSEAFEDMEAFTETVEDRQLKEQLRRALQGRGPFRRFRDTLYGELGERERWLQFRRTRLRDYFNDWLASLEIEPIWEHFEYVEHPQRLPLRAHLLAGVLKFVKTASTLPGVKRIALIGSLTTNKKSPNDADLLVTIADDIELGPLAKASRQLRGHCQQENRGAEVFLANAAGQYLGRTCPWKDCAPGLRQRCQAQHCGRRHYLYDDLQVIQLQPDLIKEPPVELWPEIITRTVVPADVESILLAPLRSAG